MSALGNIGSATQPLLINVSGRVTFTNLMGHTWYRNSNSEWRWLIDEATQIGALGVFAPDAAISVITTEALKELTETADDATETLRTLIGEGKALYDFVIGLFSETYEKVCSSEMYFRIDLYEYDKDYDGSLEGCTVYVLAAVNGKLVIVKTTVKDGLICLRLDELGMQNSDFGYTQFAVVSEAAFEELQSAGITEGASVSEFSGIPQSLPAFPKKK